MSAKFRIINSILMLIIMLIILPILSSVLAQFIEGYGSYTLLTSENYLLKTALNISTYTGF